MSAKRRNLVNRLASVMEKNSGWLDLIPEAAPSYHHFLTIVESFPPEKQRAEREDLLRKIAGDFVGQASKNGIPYASIAETIGKLEQQYGA
jgi:hypothetical protein